ncbi:glycosyltransferase [Microbispora sp. RL4-1S]|uniref:Glycosyltransferase n=1 Tax=Microbispora oryzae TaxID=2806554 RepID=A0A941AKK2_9ACTN|nr:glycosyltransferase [Microbispora oryzae]MBP2705343.1 glycosyltransferase [Microbispora oryzae]
MNLLASSPPPAVRPAEPVLIATDTYPPDVNGAAYFTRRLASGLAARGNRVHVVCASADGPPGGENADGVVVHRLRSVPLAGHPAMRVGLPVGLGHSLSRLIERISPRVVHVQGHLVVAGAAVRAARRAGVPVVATSRFVPDDLARYGRVPARLRGPAGRLARRDLALVLAVADHVTTPAPAAGPFPGGGVARAVEAVSCGVDLRRFRPGPQAGARRMFGLDDRPTILFVGRLHEVKRLGDLVRALPHVLNLVDAQVVVAGAGGLRGDLERLATRIGVGGRVRFLGFVPDAELPHLYPAADVFAMPGAAESQSIATLEAMASGLPVVAAGLPGRPHLVSGNGLLYPPGDVKELARCLTAILSSAESRASMSRASLALAAEHDHERSFARFEELYTELSGKAKAKNHGNRS